MYDCIIKTSSFNHPNYQLTGFVSTQGYYSNNLNANIKYPYGLFCDSSLILNRADGVASFNFSDPLSVVARINGKDVNGSGMVASTTSNKVQFDGEAKQGFANCQIRNGNCELEETCVAKISNADVGVLADCNYDSVPYINSFQNKICCGTKEYCRDGIDNDGDTFIDCADPDCFPDPSIGQPPQRCDPDPASLLGNQQTTNECISVDPSENVINSPHCIYDHPFEEDKLFYCSYGKDDNPTTSTDNAGYCCPQGQYYDESQGNCQVFTKCGIEAGTPCQFNFADQKYNWINDIYDGGSNWCNSRLPLFTNVVNFATFRSEACCPVVIHGTFDYFIVDENVKIYGYK